MNLADTLISCGKRALTSTLMGMVRWSRYYRRPVLGLLGVLRLKNLVLASSIARRLLLTRTSRGTGPSSTPLRTLSTPPVT